MLHKLKQEGGEIITDMCRFEVKEFGASEKVKG